MVAPVKFSQMSETERENTANGIMDAVRGQVAQCGRCELKNWDCGHGLRPFGTHYDGDYIDFAISVADQKWKGMGSYDLREVAGRLLKAMAAEGMECDKEWHPDADCDVPVSVSKLNGCPEFSELKEMLAERGLSIGTRSIYRCEISGKRGRITGEGWREYASESPEMCRRIMDKVRQLRGPLTLKTVDDVDPMDVEHSRYYETELYGYRRVEVVER